MNPVITTLEPAGAEITTQNILSEGGFTGSILRLISGAEIPEESDPANDRIIVIVEGAAEVRSEGINTVLNKDMALLVPQGKVHAIVAISPSWTKLLKFTIPPRQVTAAPIITLSP